MKKEALQLIECLRAFRAGNMTARIIESLTADEWHELYNLSSAHKLVPVVYEMLHTEPGFFGGDKSLAILWKRDAIIQAVGQTARTQKLLELTAALEEKGITYAVVKGAICRELYKKPDLRPSGDEDIFVNSGDIGRCTQLFYALGMEMLNNDDPYVAHWQDSKTGLHVELHSRLFSTGWTAEDGLNAYFDAQLQHTVTDSVESAEIRTLQPTAHLLFLIAHALKHFITGGFGIRTLADILSYCEQYEAEIDKKTLWAMLDDIHGSMFFRKLLLIGSKYLEFDTAPWGGISSDKSDENELLQDILDAGIYGQTSMDRKHSGALSLRAVSGNGKLSLLKALFPGAQQLMGRYPSLGKCKALLPFCWSHRMACYLIEIIRGRGEGNTPSETLALGNKRTEMMVRYGILPKAKTENR